jgi:hypothetical protein
MPGIKDLIEQLHQRYGKLTLRLTFHVEGHDLLDDYDPRASNVREHDADFSQVAGEYLALPWYPGKEFWPEECEGDDNQAVDKAIKREKEQAIAALAQWDEYAARPRQGDGGGEAVAGRPRERHAGQTAPQGVQRRPRPLPAALPPQP